MKQTTRISRHTSNSPVHVPVTRREEARSQTQLVTNWGVSHVPNDPLRPFSASGKSLSEPVDCCGATGPRHTSAYVRIRQHTALLGGSLSLSLLSLYSNLPTYPAAEREARQHTSAYVRICQHTSAYVSKRQAYVSIRLYYCFNTPVLPLLLYNCCACSGARVQNCTSVASMKRSSKAVVPAAERGSRM